MITVMTTRLPVFARRRVVQDATLAAGLLAAVVLIDGPSLFPGGPGPDPTAGVRSGQVLLWSVAAVLVLAAITFRRHWPVPMLAVGAVASTVRVDQTAPVTVIDLVNIGLLVLLYSVAARYGPRAVSLAALAGTLALLAAWNTYFALGGRPMPGVPQVAFDAGTDAEASTIRPDVIPAGLGGSSAFWAGLSVLGPILIASWAIGVGVHNRRAYLSQLRARARDMERQRDQQAALAAAAERDRITRELHDVVAHGLAVIVIQAQGAHAALDSRPADTRAALAKIVETGRDSLADIRRTLSTAAVADDTHHPQPGLTRLPALLAQVRMAGTPVRLNVEGTATVLPPTVDLSVYRIVQEALTNIIKHTDDGTSAEVLVRYTAMEVGIEIRDDGTGTNRNTSDGNGLRGMRERARLLGGRFTAGPRLGGGFAVRATFPTDGRRT